MATKTKGKKQSQPKNFVAEDIRLFFQVQWANRPEGLVSYYTFLGDLSDEQWRNRRAKVRMATAFRPSQGFHRVNLRWNKAKTMLIAIPVNAEELAWQARREAVVSDFEPLLNNRSENPAFRHRKSGAIVFLAPDLPEMPAEGSDTRLILVGTQSSVYFLTTDESKVRTLSLRSDDDLVNRTDWDSPLLQSWRPIDLKSLMVGVYEVDGKFVKLTEDIDVDALLGISRQSDSDAIAKALKAAKRKLTKDCHPDVFECRDDIMPPHKRVLRDAFAFNLAALEYAAERASERFEFLMRRRMALQEQAKRWAEEEEIRLKSQTPPTPVKKGGKRKMIDMHKASASWYKCLLAIGMEPNDETESIGNHLTLHTDGRPEELGPDDADAITRMEASGLPSEKTQELLDYVRQNFKSEPTE